MLHVLRIKPHLDGHLERGDFLPVRDVRVGVVLQQPSYLGNPPIKIAIIMRWILVAIWVVWVFFLVHLFDFLWPAKRRAGVS